MRASNRKTGVGRTKASPEKETRTSQARQRNVVTEQQPLPFATGSKECTSANGALRNSFLMPRLLGVNYDLSKNGLMLLMKGFGVSINARRQEAQL